MELKGKRAIITGGADGIGLAIAKHYVREGARVLVFDVNGQKLEAALEQLREGGASADGFVGSVANEADVEAAFGRADELFGRVDILVNNAGVSGNYPSLELETEQWQRVIDINLNGVFYCTRAAGRRMTRQAGGSIVNIASAFGVIAAPRRLAYCAAKSGVVMLTKVLATEWGPLGVRLNAIGPGYVKTALVDELVEQGKLDLEQLINRTPMRRLASPEDIAELAVFLGGDKSKNISGQIVAVDAGWMANGFI